MTLNKGDIIRSVQEQVRFRSRLRGRQMWLFPEMNTRMLSRQQAGRLVNTLFEKVKAALARGEDVSLRGFGRFQVKFRWARKGRHPQTGEMLILGSRRTVTFRPSSRLREKMNVGFPPGAG